VVFAAFNCSENAKIKMIKNASMLKIDIVIGPFK
jgi:hypothetical protein